MIAHEDGSFEEIARKSRGGDGKDIVNRDPPDNIRATALQQRNAAVRGRVSRGVEKGWSSRRGGL
jgi:hypothetical protein